MLVILQNKLLQPFNPILQQEIINTKCRNGKNKNKRCMWIRSEKKKSKLYKRNLRLLAWPSSTKLKFLWRRPRLRSLKWHQTSLFPSIQLHLYKKWKWTSKNTSFLHKKTKKNQSLEENLNWYLYKMMRKHFPWKEEAFCSKIPQIVDMVPNTRNLH